MTNNKKRKQLKHNKRQWFAAISQKRIWECAASTRADSRFRGLDFPPGAFKGRSRGFFDPGF